MAFAFERTQRLLQGKIGEMIKKQRSKNCCVSLKVRLLFSVNIFENTYFAIIFFTNGNLKFGS